MRAARWILVLGVLFVAAGQPARAEEPGAAAGIKGKETGKKEIRILWIGASSTTHRLFKITEDMLTESGQVTVKSTRAGNSTYVKKIREGG